MKKITMLLASLPFMTLLPTAASAQDAMVNFVLTPSGASVDEGSKATELTAESRETMHVMNFRLLPKNADETVEPTDRISEDSDMTDSGPVNISGGITVRNAYDLKMVRVSGRPVTQAWVNLSIPNTPCSVGVWGSLGVEEAGNELDVSASCPVGDIGTFTLEAYELPGGPTFEIIAPKFTTSTSGVNFTAQVMFVNGGENGAVFSAAYPISATGDLTITPAVHAGIAPYSGQEFFTVDAGASHPIADNLSVAGLVRYKVEGPDAGVDVNVGVTFTF